MPSIKRPRFGSMQFWPRKKAKKIYSRVRSWANSKHAKPLAFMGYKVGMTHLMVVIDNKNSHLKGEEVSIPATIVECPPMRINSARFYSDANVSKEIFFKAEKELIRKIKPAKNNVKDLDSIKSEDFENITITAYTQPSKAGFGKKKPEIFELGLGSSNQNKLEFIKQNYDKEILLSSVFEENHMVDIRAITKAKGFQGPVRRFGIGIRNHKSEKGIRTPGSLGPWVRQQHISHRVAHAGQTGFHQRIEYNKQILKISDDTTFIGKDFHKYGNVKSTYVILHGSIPGSKKRPVILSECIRLNVKNQKLTIQ